ncbi:MAG: 3-dehydroquinate synthase [Desulfobacterales bacterium]|nr:3-dehydroquinate synthase [Desulfobacterales bacterium]
MVRHTIKGSTGTSELLVGESIDSTGNYLPDSQVFIITDTVVEKLYADRFPSGRIISLGTGEKIKTLDTVVSVFDQLIEAGADRSSFILGIGGGIVCDITGFVASTFMRGVRFGFVSTTLLAQVDASVGGKNGVNFAGYKNMVGVFSQPEFVICDMDLLQSLPSVEVRCGMAEIVKHAAIEDSGMFAYLEENAQKAVDLNPVVIEKLVSDSVVIKAAVVNRDEKEHGERRKLNFGHTVGHAVEKTKGIPHGEAVSIGMAVAAAISEKRELLDGGAVKRLTALLHRLGLPTIVDADPGQIVAALAKDKKKEKDVIHYVLLDGIGSCRIEEISIAELNASVRALV